MTGRFVWHELMTTDPAAAGRFYAAVVGWEPRDSGMPGMNYTLLHMGATQMAGMMARPAEAAAMGVPPHWMGYVEVADVDAKAAEAVGLGATIHVPGTDIPGVGRFAVIGDPQGAAIALFRGDGSGPLPDMATVGAFVWHELATDDPAAALGFYAKLFGWTRGEAMDMGPMGTYQMFAAAGAMTGGMMKKPDGMPMACWLYYARVPSIEAAQARIASAGGRVVNGPMEIPGGEWVVHGIDPQGAMFALVGQK